jgi:hypothetical protein
MKDTYNLQEVLDVIVDGLLADLEELERRQIGGWHLAGPKDDPAGLMRKPRGVVWSFPGQMGEPAARRGDVHWRE